MRRTVSIHAAELADNTVTMNRSTRPDSLYLYAGSPCHVPSHHDRRQCFAAILRRTVLALAVTQRFADTIRRRDRLRRHA